MVHQVGVEPNHSLLIRQSPPTGWALVLGSPTWARTRDLPLNRRTLICHLSYRGMKEDMRRNLGYEICKCHVFS